MLLEIKEEKITNFEELSNYLANKRILVLNEKEEKNEFDLQKNRKKKRRAY